MSSDEALVPHSVMQSQIDAAVLAERERCARIAGQYGFHVPAARLFAGEIAKAIRWEEPRRYGEVPKDWL